jgi:hypothetical protein
MNQIIQLLLQEIEKNPQVVGELISELVQLFAAKPALLQQAVQELVANQRNV